MPTDLKEIKVNADELRGQGGVQLVQSELVQEAHGVVPATHGELFVQGYICIQKQTNR